MFCSGIFVCFSLFVGFDKKRGIHEQKGVLFLGVFIIVVNPSFVEKINIELREVKMVTLCFLEDSSQENHYSAGTSWS